MSDERSHPRSFDLPYPRHSILSPAGIVIAVIVGATASGWTSSKLVEGWQWVVARAFETGPVLAGAASLVTVLVLIIGVGLQIAAIAYTLATVFWTSFRIVEAHIARKARQ
ncbi:hypothetical protein GQ649_29600 [Rhodococcus sp. DSM 6344]|nr:hypothetical protein [Rhodococcus erythropolis]